MIKAVLFDFGGVLTEGGKKGFIGETLAGLYGVVPSEIDIGDLHYMMRRGKGTEEGFFEELNKRYGGSVTKEEFLKQAHTLTMPAKEVYVLAETLRAHGIKTGILSNVFAMNAEQLRREGRYEGFGPIILSCEEGCAKPEEKFYEAAIARVGVRPEEILFIDDQSKCLPPAQKLGMHTVLAESPSQIVADTKAFIRKHNSVDL